MADLGNSGTKLCNNCGQEINNASFMMHEAFCLRNIIKCEKCKKPIDKNVKDDHFTEFHAPVECECGEKIEKMFLENHKSETCKKRKAQCFYCDLTLEFGKMKEHMDFCGTRTEKCAKCEKFIMHKDKNRHEESNCSYPVSTQPTTSKQDRLVLKKPTRPVENPLSASIRQNQARGLIKTETRKKSNADENFNLLPCEFCSESFPTDELFQHQVNCDQNRTFTRASNREDNDFEFNRQPRFFERPTNNNDEIEGDDESSFNMGHLTDYMNQYKRYKDTATNLFDSDDDQGIDVSSNRFRSTNNNEDQNTIPCEFCNRPISLDLIEVHQISCEQNFGISSYNLPRSSSMPKPFSGELSSFYVPNENKPTRLNRPTPTASNNSSSEKSPVKTRTQLRTFKDVSNNNVPRSSGGVTVKKFPIGGTSVAVVNETRRKEDQESNQKPKIEPRRSSVKTKTTNPNQNPNPKTGQKSNKKQ